MVEKLTLNDLRYIVEQATKELLKESYGISELVSSEASSLLDIINKKINDNTTYKKTYTSEGGLIKRFVLSFNHFFFSEYLIRVDLDICVGDTVESVMWFKEKYLREDEISFSPTNSVLTFNMTALCGDIDGFEIKRFGGDFEGLLEHELKHAYQYYMKRGAYSKTPYNNEKTEELYYLNKVERKRLLSLENCENTIFWDINNCIYHSLKVEQTAFQQQIYKDIINHVKNQKEIYSYMREYDYYLIFERLKTLKDKIVDDEFEINEYIKNTYGKDIQWFYKVLDHTIKNMRHTINKAIWMAMGRLSSKLSENFNKKLFKI